MAVGCHGLLLASAGSLDCLAFPFYIDQQISLGRGAMS